MNDCLFCNIIEKKINADIVHEDEACIVIKDINPKASIHWLLIPKPHIPSLNELAPEHTQVIMSTLLNFKSIAQQAGLTDGYRTIINTGPGGGQEIPHIHFHLLGGNKLPGF